MNKVIWTIALLLGVALSSYAAGPELLQNPGFEGTYSGGKAPSWNADLWNGATASFSRTTTNVHGGSSAQRVVVQSLGNGGGVFFYQSFSFIPGHTYQASIWVRSSTNSDIQFVLRQPSNNYQNGAAQGVRVGSAWQKLTIKGGFAGSPDQSYLGQFGIYFRSTGTIYLDDASLMDITSDVNTASVDTQAVIAPQFFGIHVNKLGDPQYGGHANWPAMNQGMIRLWDTQTTWAEIERSNDTFDFSRLDEYINYILSNNPNARIIYTLGTAPNWATNCNPPSPSPFYPNASTCPPDNLVDWDDYVSKLANRYKGKIKYWEVWNEADSSDFYTGSISQMVQMAQCAYNILKSVDPNNIVLSPNITDFGVGWLDDYLAQGGGQFANVIAFHTYTGLTPEYNIPYWQAIKDVMSRRGLGSLPLWDTEGATARQGVTLTNSLARASVARSYLARWAYGIRNFSWYGWDVQFPSDTVRLSIDNLLPDLADGGKAYREIASWLQSTRMVYKSITPENIWFIDIQGNNGYIGHIIWSAFGGVYSISTSYWPNVRQMRDLNGNVTSLIGSNGFLIPQVTVGSEPILLEENWVTNPSFEADSGQYNQTITGWVESGNVSASYVETYGGGYSGSHHGTHYATYSYAVDTTQTIANLPNGTYTLSAWVKSFGPQSFMYIKGFGGSNTEADANINPWLPTWTQIIIPNIQVTSGQVTIGFHSNGSANQGIYFDEVQLY